jgi:hypothetical protein
MSGERPDYIEVTRAAHELIDRHGRNAFSRTERLAEQVARTGDVEAATLWKAVAHVLEDNQ